MPIGVHTTFTFPPNSTANCAKGEPGSTSRPAKGSYERVPRR